MEPAPLLLPAILRTARSGGAALDTKCSVMAFFEAVEQLLTRGLHAAHGRYLASSCCTEEWAGDGAPKLVAELKRRGVELFLLLR